MATGTKNRIRWIDLAKGICILLVVFSHVAEAVEIDIPFSAQMSSFRMPLYFILSGLFFKRYDGFKSFLKRKINKLLIPFLFFLITTSVVPYALLTHKNSLSFFLTEMNGPVYNFALWFLLCLFEINILFYVIQMMFTKIDLEYHKVCVLMVSVLFGCIGLVFGVAGYRLPFYIGTAFTAMPFFAFGWWLRNYTGFLSMPVSVICDVLIVIFCALIVVFVADRVGYSSNSIPPGYGFVIVHLCGIAGTMMVLILSKMINYLPLVSFWGRYSIIILCTHQIVIIVARHLLNNVFSGPLLLLIVLLTTILVCHLLILFMRRFMPHVTAQKDVIKV